MAIKKELANKGVNSNGPLNAFKMTEEFKEIFSSPDNPYMDNLYTKKKFKSKKPKFAPNKLVKIDDTFTSNVDIKNVIQDRFNMYNNKVKETENNIFSYLSQLSRDKNILNKYNDLLNVELIEVSEVKKDQKFEFGNFINTDKTMNVSCFCPNIKCGGIHLNDGEVWTRLNYNIFIYIGNNE